MTKSMIFQAFLIYEPSPLKANPMTTTLISSSNKKVKLRIKSSFSRTATFIVPGFSYGSSIAKRIVENKIKKSTKLSKCLCFTMILHLSLKQFSSPHNQHEFPNRISYVFASSFPLICLNFIVLIENSLFFDLFDS